MFGKPPSIRAPSGSPPPVDSRRCGNGIRFLHLDGVIEESLIFAVPSVAGRRLVSLPKGLAPDQVRRLFASCDGTTRRGCRDIAILTMLVRLGMRSGEVAKLRLDDIDWRAGEIIVRGKANSIERIPLTADVGRAVAQYLQCGRPVSAQGRTVFVRIKAPHRHLSSCGVSNVVADAAKRAGLGRIHAHRLRHTAAMQMLRAGASLPEIGQLLRHRRALTTAIYAKVDRDTLRMIARPWPGDAHHHAPWIAEGAAALARLYQHHRECHEHGEARMPEREAMALGLDGDALDRGRHAGSGQRLPTTEGSQAASSVAGRPGSSPQQKLTRRPCSPGHRRLTSISAATLLNVQQKAGHPRYNSHQIS